MVKKGHIPLRTCIGCEEKKPKKEMIRIVRQEENIFVDPTGKASGRGAYICVNFECLKKALTKKAFSYALRSSISPEVLESLKKNIEQEIMKRGERNEKKDL